MAVATASDRLAIQHQKDVATVAGGVASAVIQTAMGADPAAISFWFSSALDGLLTRIQAGYALNRRSAMGYLPQHGALNGVTVSPVPGSLDIASTRARLEITGPVAFKRAIAAGVDQQQALESMASQMGGVSDELVRNGDRDVIHATASHGASGVIGWRRRLSGRACGFCAMLASRGSVYLSELSASQVVGRGRSVETAIRPKRAKGIHPRGTQSLGASYHPHCRCWPEPLYAHELEPPEVQRLQRQWRRVTAGKSGNDAMRTWRRHWEQRATPAARAREGIVTRPTAALDDYTERAMTVREVRTASLEQEIATAAADRAEYVKSWERAIAREGPNGDPATLAYYRRALEAAKTRPARLRNELAELRRSKDPALEALHPTQKLRSGTPSTERAQAYARGRIGDNVPAADRPAIMGELDRQAALVPRSTMRLGQVRFGEVGEDISFGGDPLAAYSPFEDILYSRRWLESRAAVEEAVERSNASKHWTRYDGEHGSIGGTTAHEFGHHVDRMISRAPEQAKQLAEAISREFHFPLPPKTVDFRAEIDRFVKENQHLVSVEVSKYGAKNANEMFAEIWREYSSMGAAARPKIRRIGELMRQLAEDNAFGSTVARSGGKALAQEAADLSVLKLTELRALAKERGLTGYSKLTKPQLLERLGGEAKPVTVVKPVAKPGDLSGLKVTELRALAKERGVAGYSKLTKPQLLERLGGKDQIHEQTVRNAYQQLQRRPGDWVSLADLRDQMLGMSRSEQDEALKAMALKPDVHIIPWDNRNALTARDHAAALRFGGQENHAIRIESLGKPVTPPPENDLVIAARERQAAIDYARARATLLTEAEHWLDSQGSFETMGVQLRRDAKRLGIEGHKDVAALFRALDSGSEAKVRKAIDTIAGKQKLARIESAGDVVPFDRTKHTALGSGVRDGQYVVVVRPGYTFDRNGELIRLHKATVEAATKEEIAAIPSVRNLANTQGNYLHLTGYESGKLDDQVAKTVERLFGGEFEGLRTANLDIVHANEKSLTVHGEILDSAGTKVGTFKRGFVDLDGEAIARHYELVLDPSFQGQGFAEAFNRRLVDWYRRAGVKRIELTANVDVGGYAWARAGYDWAGPESAKRIQERLVEATTRGKLRNQARRLIPTSQLDAQMKNAADMLARMKNLNFTDDAYPTPYEISQLGRWIGAGKNDWWIGKVALMGSEWHAVKIL